jgi:hypothetical protein
MGLDNSRSDPSLKFSDSPEASQFEPTDAERQDDEKDPAEDCSPEIGRVENNKDPSCG